MAKEPVNKKGVTLIIVVFAMMLFGVLGWTLARMQATDFESNLRTFEPDNALNLAEAGSQYALNILSQNSCMRTVAGAINLSGCSSNNSNRDMDCDDLTNADWLTTPHSLSPGQYNLCVRDPCPACSPVENGDVVIVSRGYIPSQSGSRTMRQIKLEVDIGSLTNAVQTQAADPDDISAGLFNWSSANNFPPDAPIHNPTRIEGAISAGHYEGDADVTPDEIGIDYDPQPAPILPDDNNNPEDDIRDFPASYPAITMGDFNAAATNRWPPAGRTVSLQATVTAASDGNDLRVTTANFFNNGASMVNMAVHNISDDLDNDWDVGEWAAITFVNTGLRAQLDGSVDTENWRGKIIELSMRFYNGPNYNDQRWYMGSVGGETADTVIDARNGNVDFNNASIVGEGNIVLKGPRRIRMTLSGGATRYPNLATQDGGIFSLDFPGVAGDNEDTLRGRRRFEGLIYSQNKEVNFNYLDGTLVYGKQVTLDGTVRIRYQNGRISSSGFVFEPSTLTWKEE